MVEYRSFCNSDPPHVLRLWHACELGRGAVQQIDQDALETVVFAQPYFDPAGLLFAEADGEVVGYAHAGFRANADGSGLDCSEGVLCAVMVLPEYRRQGIGRELVRRAEEYLRGAGAARLFAGPAEPRDPFYFGIYGGSQPAGFLESDPLAQPFFTSLGYAPVERHLVFQRNLQQRGDPVGLRLMAIRRSTQLSKPPAPAPRSWWWETRAGRLEPLELALVPKSGGAPVACVTVLGLDFYRDVRGIGLMDLDVPAAQRRKGYAQALLVEVCRRVREETIDLVEAHAREDDAVAVAVLKSAGFQQVDAGVVYERRG